MTEKQRQVLVTKGKKKVVEWWVLRTLDDGTVQRHDSKVLGTNLQYDTIKREVLEEVMAYEWDDASLYVEASTEADYHGDVGMATISWTGWRALTEQEQADLDATTQAAINKLHRDERQRMERSRISQLEAELKRLKGK